VTEHWIARFEYDYFLFPARSFLLASPPRGAQVDFNFNEAKVGIAWKF